jgi:CheY-like chemotaxis protein
MLGHILFIDDDETVRRTYERKLARIFGSDYLIECPELEQTMPEMLAKLAAIKDKVTYFIDEDLVHAGIAGFKGTELIEKIRINEPKIPIYILTSDLTRVDEQLGNIEFAIDKNKWDENRDKHAQRFLRHIETFKDIKSQQSKRFNELFEKSLFQPLTEEECEEYEELDVVRSKSLIDEAIITEEGLAKLNYQSNELASLYEELDALSKENGAK